MDARRTNGLEGLGNLESFQTDDHAEQQLFVRLAEPRHS